MKYLWIYNYYKMKYSELKPGDIIEDATAHGWVYTSTIIRSGFKKEFQFSIQPPYMGKAYEYECKGVRYISKLPKGDIPDWVQVKRGDIIIKNRR